MRLAAAASVGLLTLAMCSSAAPLSSVAVAFELYNGCIFGSMNSAQIEPSKEAVKAFIKQADENCLMWMMIWYEPVVGKGPHISDWPISEVALLDARRKMLLLTVENSLNKAIANR